MTRPAGGRAPAPLVEVITASPQWRKKPQASALIRKAIRTAASYKSISKKAASTQRPELAIVLTNDSAIRVLNRKWRKINAPTNVLSFPGKAAMHLGDIIIAYETTAREAAAEGKKFEHHLVHLALHGFLHLLGYDHDSDRAAKKMERLETDILAQLNVPDPYLMRDAGQ